MDEKDTHFEVQPMWCTKFGKPQISMGFVCLTRSHFPADGGFSVISFAMEMTDALYDSVLHETSALNYGNLDILNFRIQIRRPWDKKVIE